MGKIPPKVQLIIAIVVVLVVSIVLVLVLIVPEFERIGELEVEILASEQDLSVSRALLNRRLSYKADSAANEVELLRIANQVPEAPELPSLIIELQNAANASGLTFTQIRPGEPYTGDTADYSAIPLAVMVEGTWYDFVSYIDDLDELVRGIRVISARITQVDDDTGAYVGIAASLELEAYVMAAYDPGYVPAPPSVPTTGAAAPTTTTP